MNYIKELNAFYDWLEINLLSTSAIALWHALMHINNKAGWAEEFTVAASVLCIKTGLSDRTIRNARNELKQKGRIDWKTRKGNQSAVYKMISLFDNVSATNADKPSGKKEEENDKDDLPEMIAGNEHQEDVNNPLSEINADNVSVSVSGNTSDNVSGNASTLNKLNQTKLNYINTSTSTEGQVLNFDEEFSELAILYQQVIGQPNALTPEWINSTKEIYGFEWFKNAFLETERKGKRTKDYVDGILRNWHTGGGMKLSTDKNNSQTKKPIANKTRFHNFEQRSDKYSADQLEDIADRKRREHSEKLRKQNEIQKGEVII